MIGSLKNNDWFLNARVINRTENFKYRRALYNGYDGRRVRGPNMAWHHAMPCSSCHVHVHVHHAMFMFMFIMPCSSCHVHVHVHHAMFMFMFIMPCSCSCSRRKSKHLLHCHLLKPLLGSMIFKYSIYTIV